MGLIIDGNFTSISTDTATIRGNLTVDGAIHGDITGNVSADSLFIYQLKNNLFTVPYYFSQPLNINASVYNMHVHLDLTSEYVEDLVFAVDPDDTVQIWLSYYNSNGDIISDGMSTRFYPASTDVDGSPASQTIITNDEIHYSIQLNDLHENKPVNAAFWAIFLKPVSTTFGAMDIGPHLKIDKLVCCTWPNTG